MVRPVAHHPAVPDSPVFARFFWAFLAGNTHVYKFHGDRSLRRPTAKFVLVTQSSRGIDLALLRLDLLEVKCSSLVKKYQGPSYINIEHRDWERCPHKKRGDAHISCGARLKTQLTQRQLNTYHPLLL